MAWASRCRYLIYNIFAVVLCRDINAYSIPDVTIEVLSPKGFRASIPDTPNLGLFAFHGHINRAITSTDVGTISGEVIQPTNGRWLVEDLDVQLKTGDVLHYYVFVSYNSVGYLKDNLNFTVGALQETTECFPTVTRVRGGTACAGRTIFEDNFDTFREEHWQIEQYIPVDHPEYPFVSYQRIPSTVSVADGHLRISSLLQQNLPGYTNDSIYSGTLDLFAGCTGSANECSFQASGARILPPVVSGRITSRIHFTYGTVHVRAKVPRGDWIYPEILLEPFLKKYGSLNYMSGVIKIAAARGNEMLVGGGVDFSNKVLYGGPIMDLQCREKLITKSSNGKPLGEDFHMYSVKWTPDSIELLVDDRPWARIDADQIRSLSSSQCSDLPRHLLNSGSKMAPFDDYFYLTLGVAAGGITEFPDGSRTRNSHEKPWRNQGRKASLQFWEELHSWLPSWSNPELVVDYVKIVAL